MSIAARLAREWSSLTAADVPDEVAEVARHCLLDWIGCALAGSREPLAGILRDEAAGAAGPSTLVGTSRTAAAGAAALVNGGAGHALDFDDTHTVLAGHPTVPVAPAMLALAEELDAPGSRVLAAFVAGVEVECRVGALVNPAHYRVGWHATGTLGTFGAAAACAHLLGLDADRFAHALALAGTQAAGLKASFGTMAKPLHAGKAASDGLLAARLAAAGFTGNPAIIEANQGLAQAAGGETVDGERLDRLDGRWLVRETLFKYHAACYLTHASINAAQALAGKVDAGDIDTVEVLVAPDSLDVCNIRDPVTGLEGKFSLRATTAMALLGDDTADMAAYSDTRMRDPALVSLRDRVTVVPDAGRWGTCSKVVVTTTAGERLEAEDDTGRPADDLALQRERLTAKFRGLATPVLGDANAVAVVGAVADVADLRSIRELMFLARA